MIPDYFGIRLVDLDVLMIRIIIIAMIIVRATDNVPIIDIGVGSLGSCIGMI